MRNIYSLADQGLADAHEQGSEAWLAGRMGRITGSKPSDLSFDFKQASDWDKILNKWFGNEKKVFDELAKSRMAWGSKHEDSAVDVVVDSIPNSHFFECPQININEVYAASADGAIVVLEADGTPKWHANVEIKCPGRFDKKGNAKTPAQMVEYVKKTWKTPARYYMTQIHMEMAAQKSAETLFVVWTPHMTRMWRIPFNQRFWDLCLEVFENFRLKNIPFDVMFAKIKKLQGMAWSVSNFPIWKDVYTEMKEEDM